MRKCLELAIISTLLITVSGCQSSEDTEPSNKQPQKTDIVTPSATVSIGSISESGKDNQVTVTLKNPIKTDAIITWTITHIDTNNDDFLELSGQLTIPANSRTASFIVPVVDDDIYEKPTERFSIGFSVTDDIVLEARYRNLPSTLADNEAPPTISFETQLIQVNESAGVVEATLLVSPISDSPITGNMSLTGTATNGDDYTVDATDFNIAALTAEIKVPIHIKDDTLREGGESIVLHINNADADIASEDTFTAIILGDVTLNDTGVTSVIDQNNVVVRTAQSRASGQDADIGYDVKENNDIDGPLGFSFSQLDAHGNELPFGSPQYSCILDNRTGLIWEVKRESVKLEDLIQEVSGKTVIDSTNNYRATNYLYNWYSSDSSISGGSLGSPNDRFPNGQMFDTDGYCAYKPEQEPRRYILRCNSDIYLKEINYYGLCGSKQWRLPTIEELRGIGNYEPQSLSNNHLYLEPLLFRNMPSGLYWSGTPSAEFDASSWCMDIKTGKSQLCHKGSLQHIMAVTRASE